MSMVSGMEGRRVLVLGLGRSGMAMARWCARLGAQVTVWDSRTDPPQACELARELPAARAWLGVPAMLDAAVLAGAAHDHPGGAPFDAVYKSPGLAPHDPAIAGLLATARQAGRRVGGEVDLFAQALAVLRADTGYAPQVLALTGTNGKTTTTALTALLVARTGRRVVAAGNIGPTLLDTLAQALDAQALPQVWVLELSSFQLHDAGDFQADAAVVLNLSQDHLDWHGTMAAYAAAKARVYGRDAVMVINRDDPAVEAMVPASPSAPGPRTGRAGAAPARRTVVRFGLGAPTAAGDFGLVEAQGMAWLVRAQPDDDGSARPRRRATASVEAATPAFHLQRLMPAAALRLRGRHNAANALAALALASAIGCPLAPMLHGLREYRGEPHRMAPVGMVGEVEAFDDSNGTNVGATVAALEGLGAERAPARLVVILGGEGKGQDFAPLAAPVAQHARAVALIGRDAGAIEAALAAHPGAAGVPRARHGTLQEAVRWCVDQARPGDAVLLSPACASLDMFRHYGHRAEVFAQAVRDLAAERGEVVPSTWEDAR